MNTLKLYGGARSRASIVRWYLEEFAIPYEFVLLDMANGEHRKPEFLALNPFGKVPAILDGDLALWESGAILLYLAEKHGQLPAEIDRRAIYTQWILFANSTLTNGLLQEAIRERETPLLLAPLDPRISHKIIFRSHNPYLVKVKQNKGFNSVLFFLSRRDRGQSFIT